MATVYLREFPDDLHHRVKVRAAQERTTMKDLIIRLLEEYLDKADQRKEGQ